MLSHWLQKSMRRKKCHSQASANHLMSGMVIQDGKARDVTTLSTSDKPSTPVVLKPWPKIVLKPVMFPSAEGCALILSNGSVPLLEDFRQNSIELELKILSPLISRMVMHTTFVQCISRISGVWRVIQSNFGSYLIFIKVAILYLIIFIHHFYSPF